MSSEQIDFNDLLRWSMNYQENYPTDGPSPNVKPMSDEDRSFLLDAMDQHVMDEQKRVKVLLRVLRLPEDPKLLHKLQYINHNSELQVLKDKATLRTLLEMRKEDEKRKAEGKYGIGKEYIPTNYINYAEVLKERLEREGGDIKTTDIDAQIQNILATIPQPTEAELSALYTSTRKEKLEALEEIEDRTFRADNAVGFVTYNGIPILKHYLLSADFEMASHCFRLLGNIVSNQAFCQQKAIEYNLVPIAIEALNITRYIPYLLADYKTQQEQQNLASEDDDFEPSEELESIDAIIGPILQQYDVKSPQFGEQYQHFLPGKFYCKHILSLLKSVIYFLTSLCNNNSTAQTQFVQYHGLIALSYLLELGTLFTPKSTQFTTHVSNYDVNSSSFPSQLFYALIYPQKSLFKQVLRRVLQLLVLLVDGEYHVTTSAEICDMLSAQATGYNNLTTHAQFPAGESIFHFTYATTKPVTDVIEADNSNVDHGMAHRYFQEPIAPLIVENGLIHPAFKLKNNRLGGKLNLDGEHIEEQFPLHNVMANVVLHAFPLTLWDSYLNNMGKYDKQCVTLSLRLMGLILSNNINFDKNKTIFETLLTQKGKKDDQQDVFKKVTNTMQTIEKEIKNDLAVAGEDEQNLLHEQLKFIELIQKGLNQ